MRLQKTKVLTGATLSLLLSLTTIYPAIARPASQQTQDILIAQMDDTASIRGKIRSIVGNVVTLELPDGSTQDVMISRAERERLGLSPGMEIMTSMRNGSLVVEVVNADSDATATTDNSSMSSESSSEAMSSGTTRRRVVEETVIRRRTTTAPAVEQNTEQTSGDVQQSVQEVDQNSEMTTQENIQRARPVRALW